MSIGKHAFTRKGNGRKCAICNGWVSDNLHFGVNGKPLSPNRIVRKRGSQGIFHTDPNATESVVEIEIDGFEPIKKPLSELAELFREAANMLDDMHPRKNMRFFAVGIEHITRVQ